jgi:DNA-binding response OmpR family regulator
MALVLVITPEQTIADLCRQALSSSGHAVTLCPNPAAAMRAMLTLDVDALCVDAAASSSGVEDFWSWLESDQERSRLPVLFLLSPTMRWVRPPERFRPGFDALAFKPLAAAELEKELASLLRASAGREGAYRRRFIKSRSGPFIADSEHYELWADGKNTRLTPMEFRLFTYLMERTGTPVPIDELLENVWGFPPGTGGSEVVRAHVYNLRRKMKAFGEKALLLQTVSHRGYRLSSSAPQHT